MNNLTCRKCGEKISNDFKVTLSYCTSCGANIELPPTEMKTAPLIETAPSTAKPGKTSPILLVGIFAALILLTLSAFVAYRFINQESVNIPPENAQTKSPENDQAIQPPRKEKRSPISVSDISRIEFYRVTSESQTASAFQLLGNVNPENFVTREVGISFSSDGKAVKIGNESRVVKGAKVSTTPQRQTGTVTSEQFAALAEAFISNDFMNEPDSKTSTSLPTKFELTVKYSSGEKKIQTSNSGTDTPESAAMLQAFQNLENQIVWKEG